MLTMERVRRDFGKEVCRVCINNRYHIKLHHDDCRYHHKNGPCPQCGEDRHIVADFAKGTFWKRLFK